MPVRWAILAVLALSAALAGGCRSIYSKGTPFYKGPVNSKSERLQMWPLAYYQEPNLSIMWPIFERTPDHLAVRPLWSVYGLDEQRREYNVLWPLGQFDRRTGDSRIFPFFWGGEPGSRYFVAFPEIWWYPEGKAVLPFFWGGSRGNRYFVAFPWIWSFPGRGMAFPFFWGGGEGRRHFVAFPEVWWYPENKAIFPFLWGGSGRDRYFVGFPMVWWLPDDRCIPPVYWSRDGDHAAVFPLFWYGRGEYCHLLPLWLRFSEAGGTDTHVLPPIFNYKRTSESEGWRFWPLAGDYRAPGGGYRYSFGLWPLGHYRRSGDERMRLFLPLYYDFAGRDAGRRAVVPLYYGQWDKGRSFNLTPIYSSGHGPDGSWSLCLPLYYRAQDAAGRSGRLVTPLFAHTRDGDRSWTMALPALSWMSRDGADRDLWGLGPLFHARWGGATHQGHLLPLYCYDREQDFLFTPLYAQGGGATPWSVLVPLYYRRSDPKAGSSLLVTPLFGRSADKERTRWTVLPALSCMTWDGDEKSLWALGPLAHFSWGGRYRQNHVLPLYYYSGENRLFLSPLYAQGGSPERRWSFLLPAYWHQSEPLRGSSRLVTPLFGRFAEGSESRWLFWPALSSLRSNGDDRDLWALGPLAHFRWGAEHRQSHVFPLYFHDRESRTFVSLPFSRRGGESGFWNAMVIGAHSWWDGPDSRRLLVPPALTYFGREGKDRDLWTLGPLAHFRWGGEHHQSHVLPLYLYDREERLLLTLPFSRREGYDGFWNFLVFGAHRWRSGPDGSGLLLPPALTYFGREGPERDLWTLGPLVHFRWGGDRHQSHVLPLYLYDREKDLFLTLPFSRRGGGDGFWNVLGLLAHSSVDYRGHRTTRLLAPFTAFAHSPEYGRASVYPIFSTSREGDSRSTWVLPWILTETSPSRTHCSFFPLWWYESHRSAARGCDRNFHVLGWLYDDHRENIGAPASEDGKRQAPPEHVRRRVLWKIWDYERVGQDVAVDAFPFVSYDKRPDEGMKRFSFAWRLFRWERSTAGGKKLDVLFIPLMRRAGEGNGGAEPKAGPAEVSPPSPTAPVAAGERG